MNNWAIAGIAAVAVVMLIAGFRGRKYTESLRGYFLVDGRLPLGPFVGTLAATNFSLGNMIFLSLIWGYFYGVAGMLWLIIGFIVAAWVYVWFVRAHPQVSQYIDDRTNGGSLHEYLAHAFAPSLDSTIAVKIRLVASLTTVLCLVIALTLELYLAAQILAPVLGADAATVFVVTVVLICAYSALGGFYSVVATDILQGVLLVAGVILIGAILWRLDLPMPDAGQTFLAFPVQSLLAPKWTGILSILGVTFAWYLVTMDTWQRACAARNHLTATSGMKIGTGILLLGIAVFCSLGMYDATAILPALSPDEAASHSGGLNPINDIALVAQRLPGVWSVLIGIVLVCVLMAALSTADTFLVVSAHSVVSDLMVGVARRTSFDNLSVAETRLYVGVARTVIVVMGLAVVALYYLLRSLGLLKDPLTLFYLAYSIQFALLPAVLCSVWKTRPSGRAVLAGLAAGIFVALLWGFGFALAATRGVQGFGPITITELVYLAPLPPMIIGMMVTIVADRLLGPQSV